MTSVCVGVRAIDLGGGCKAATVPPLRGQRSKTSAGKSRPTSVGITERGRPEKAAPSPPFANCASGFGMTAKCVGARDGPRPLRNQGQRRNGLRFWWGLCFRIFGLHQAGNVQGHRASFFLSLVPEAAAHGSGYLLAGKPALVQGKAGLERLVAALVVATGAACHEKLLARGEQADARLI